MPGQGTRRGGGGTAQQVKVKPGGEQDNHQRQQLQGNSAECDAATSRNEHGSRRLADSRLTNGTTVRRGQQQREYRSLVTAAGKHRHQGQQHRHDV